MPRRFGIFQGKRAAFIDRSSETFLTTRKVVRLIFRIAKFMASVVGSGELKSRY
jgi:hypothetical protein